MAKQRTYFEYTQGGITHFFELVVSGAEVVKRTGAVGTQGIATTVECDSAQEAQDYAAQHLAEAQQRYHLSANQHSSVQTSPSPAANTNAAQPAAPIAAIHSTHSTPRSVAVPSVHPAVQVHSIYGDFGKRFAAQMIDFAAQMSITAMVAGFTSTVLESDMLTVVTIFTTGIAYSVYFESSAWQATPGKRAMGLIVTDTHGKRISPMKAFGRLAAKIGVSTMISSCIGFLTALFTEKKQTVHDLIAGTIVYSKNEFEQAQHQSVVSSEKVILQAAQRHGGVVTTAVVAAETPLDYGESETALQTLANKGICRIELTDEGTIEYHFPELLSS
jgi:uncharacterized RDD family membrane protein YckC/predicted DNA-binding WGR domain protein